MEMYIVVALLATIALISSFIIKPTDPKHSKR